MNRGQIMQREDMEKHTRENIRLRAGRETEISRFRRLAHEKLTEKPWYLTGGKK